MKILTTLQNMAHFVDQAGDTSPTIDPSTSETAAAVSGFVGAGNDLHSTRYHPQACQFCRRRKIKCDRSLPACNQCTKGQQKCVYTASQRRGRPRNTSSAIAIHDQSKEVLLKRIKELESVVQEYRSSGQVPEDVHNGSCAIDCVGSRLTSSRNFLIPWESW